MAKTEVLNIRISPEDRQTLQQLAEPYGGNISKIIYKVIAFLKSKPQRIAELDVREPMEEEFWELSKSPEWSWRKLKEQGINSPGQLYWIAQLIQNAWSRSHGHATSAWVAQLVRAFDILSHFEIRSKEKADIERYIATNFPESGMVLSDKIRASLTRLENTLKISSSYADMIARCFLVIIRDGEIEITASIWGEINKLLSPWIFWVAKRAMLGKPIPEEVDTSPLVTAIPPSEASDWIQKTRVSVQFFSSWEGAGPFHVGARPFSCGFTFTDGKTTKAIFACTSRTFYELIQAVALLQGTKDMSTYGQWELMKNDREGAYSIQKNGVLVFIEKQEIEELIELVNELYAREDVQRDLTREYVEEFGAL